jgi:hypothetical protein
MTIYGNLKNNCLTVTQQANQNIRGSTMQIAKKQYLCKKTILIIMLIDFWTKKEALNGLKTGFHKCMQ